MADPPHSTRFSCRQATACGLFAALLDIALGCFHWREVAAGDLLNPDSYMRLVRLDAILAAHAPIHVVARDGSGTGTVLHWSHLLDSLLLVMALPLAPFLTEHDALHWAGVALGPLSAGALGAALAWAAAPLSDPAWRWIAALFGVLAMPIAAYALPGVVHHHILLALSGVMCAGWAGRAGTLGAAAGWRLGAWACFGLWLSPETMPVILMAFIGVGLGWLLQPGERRWSEALAAATTVFAVLVGLALAVDPPYGNPLAPQIDRLSVIWLVLALLGTAAGWWFRLLDRLALPPGKRALLGGLLAAAAAVVWLALFPGVLGGPEGVLNGAHPHAFDGIAEMLPITTFADAMLFLLPGVFAAIVASMLAVRQRSWLYAYVAVCVLLLLLAAVMHRRFSTWSACAGAIAVPIALSHIGATLGTRAPLAAMAARLSLLLFLLIAPFAGFLIAQPAAAKQARTLQPCSIRKAAGMLQPYAGQIVLADVNDTPELLYRTQLLTVGSLYHRDEAGYLRLRAAWRSTRTDAEPPAVQATGATLVLFCERARRSFMVTELPTDTLWDQLSRGAPPRWLTEIAADPVSGFRLFRIRH